MKKLLILSTLILSLTAGGIFGYMKAHSENYDEVSVDLVENPADIEELVRESDTIISVKTSDKVIQDNNKGLEYFLTESKVKDIYRNGSGLSKSDTILLYQNDFTSIDPLFKKNEEYLVFLVKIDTPNYTNVYRCVGLYKGKFKLIKDSKLEKYSNKDFYEDKMNEVVINIGELLDQIEQTPYAPNHLTAPKVPVEDQ